MFPEFVPIELRGMSVLTALIFCSIFIGWGSYFWWDRREHSYLNNQAVEVDDKVDLLFSKFDDANGDISEMKAHMAGIHEAVEWIKKYMETNKK